MIKSSNVETREGIRRTGKEHPDVLDGAIFYLMSDAGSDPEVLVIIEALKNKGTDDSAWHYSQGRFTAQKRGFS